MKRLVWLLLISSCFAQTLNTLNGTTVGSSAGNISGWNGTTIGTTAGNIGAWNGLTSPGGGGGLTSVAYVTSSKVSGGQSSLANIVLSETQSLATTDVMAVWVAWQSATVTTVVGTNNGAFTCETAVNNGTSANGKWCWLQVTVPGTETVTVTQTAYTTGYTAAYLTVFRCNAACTWSKDVLSTGVTGTTGAPGTINPGATVTSSAVTPLVYLGGLSMGAALAIASTWTGATLFHDGANPTHRCSSSYKTATSGGTETDSYSGVSTGTVYANSMLSLKAS